MSVVKGVKEQVHLPLYDSVAVKPGETLGQSQSTNVLRFFQDVTGKSKLETNMQAASLLPHWNTFESRAMRVVLSDLAPRFPDKPTAGLKDLEVLKADGKYANKKVDVDNLTIGNLVDLSRRLEVAPGRVLRLSQGDLVALGGSVQVQPVLADEERARVDSGDLGELRKKLADAGAIIPPGEQIVPHNGCGDVISRFIYNSVTTYYVGEKIMIQVPTWFFPAGAGPYTDDGKVTTHGYPSPEATFKFAEPVFVDAQQNFRVEIEFPDSGVLADLKRIYGPLFIWVVIDGYMTRDVQ